MRRHSGAHTHQHQVGSGGAGTSLDNLIRLTFFVKRSFPDGGVLSSPNSRLDVMEEFFAEHCPKHCSYNNPLPSEVIGVAALAQPTV